MKSVITFIALILFIIPISLYSMSKQERVDDAATIINLFTQQYGPLKWKELNLNLNFDELSGEFIRAAGDANNDKEFYVSVAKFLSSLNDAHVSYSIPSTLYAKLPFETEYFPDGVIITRVYKENTDVTYEFSEGDRLIKIDDIPVEQIINSFINFDNTGNAASSNKFIGSSYLTKRPQSIFPDIPSGKAKITFIKNKDNKELEAFIDWKRTGFDLAEMPPKSAISTMSKAMSLNVPLDKGSPIERLINSYQISMDDAVIMGTPMPSFPVWENFKVRSKSPFFTGVFTIDGHQIGFIRFASWRGSNNDERLPELEKELRYLNNNTDALIIDQTNNGGGNLCYSLKIASFFIVEPKDDMRFQVRANRSWLSELEYWYEFGMKDEKAHAKSWLDGLRRAVTNGDHLSEPISICSATGKIWPYRNRSGDLSLYIKPVLILVNELDFSAADSFPAIMQDWGAASIFGTRTAGAGGNVIETWPVGNSELSIRLTQSLMYRSREVTTDSGNRTHYIENVGVTPEFPYEITTDDYYNNYEGYRSAINKAMIDLIEKRR